MNTQVYKASQLPIKEMESLGLAKNGRILMDKSDVQAMLEGRRSDMIRLNNIVGENVKIEKLDTKISLAPDKDGNLKLQFHPIYKDPQYPSFLNEAERTALETDSALNLEKTIVGKDGKPENVLVEYDKETREFIITDTDKVQVPDMVNSEKLTFEQREKYRKGKEVELADGTKFKMDNTQKQGVISNKGKLVAAFVLGGTLGGLAYLAYTEIKNLQRKPQMNQNVKQSEGYEKAYASMVEKREDNQWANIKKTGSNYGTIVSHGKDHFQFDPQESSSYYIELAKKDGTSQHIWGVDLERALAKSGHKIGDKVQLNNLGKQLVEVDAPIKNDVGEVTSWEKKMVNRNTWEVADTQELKLNQQDKSGQEQQVGLER